MIMSCEGKRDRDGSPEVNVGQFVRQVQLLSTVWHVTVHGGNCGSRRKTLVVGWLFVELELVVFNQR